MDRRGSDGAAYDDDDVWLPLQTSDYIHLGTVRAWFLCMGLDLFLDPLLQRVCACVPTDLFCFFL